MQELKDKYEEKHFKDSDLFKLHDIVTVNHQPHPYMIGPNHVKHAADKCGGMLGEETMREVPCAVPGCGLSYEDHTSETVLFVQLKRNMTPDEAQSFLGKLENNLKSDKIDGIALVETPEKFRVDTIEDAIIIEDEEPK